MSGHVPVMLNEVLTALAPHDGGHYVDGTFGGGGYSQAILESCRCTVLGIDRDPAAIARGESLKTLYPGRLTLAHGSFSQMDAHLAEAGLAATDGVVLDLGVSSFQFDEPDRGFSFRADGPLDMRMSLSGPSAADVVNTADEKTLTGILLRYCEERKARAIVRAIVKARPITRTLALAELVAQVLGPKARAQAIHPATRTFQALRIQVNDELGELERALEAATRVLARNGRMAVVSFHSLEDRIVKRYLQSRSVLASSPSRHVPVGIERKPQYRILGEFPTIPGEREIQTNPRSRSAKMRAAEKLAA